jgi:hypothetical protein
MKVTERHKKLLAAIASSPRTAHHFTHGNLNQITSPNIIEKWLREMAEAGYVYEDKGVYHITVLGRSMLDTKDGKATVRELDWKKTRYAVGDGESSVFYQRPGSDHSHLKSYGDKC